MPEDTITIVQWLRTFATDLEDSHLGPYENVQILRRIAKHVDELEQCNRDLVRHADEVQEMFRKIEQVYEDREILFKRIISLQERQIEVGKIGLKYGR